MLRGDRLGIVGPNGAGKTTLLGLLTGTLLAPDAGEVKQGASLTTVTLDQRRASLDPMQTLAKDAMTGGHGERVIIGGTVAPRRQLHEGFSVPAGAGEHPGRRAVGRRARPADAGASPGTAGSNLLVLDEPTNDLDLETLDLLQELLGDYPGTVLVVSHDRDFLDRVATSVIAAEGDGKWVEYAGGYSDMLAQRAQRRATTAAECGGEIEVSAAHRASPAAKSRRLTFKDKHALETLPAQDRRTDPTASRSPRSNAGRSRTSIAKNPAALSSQTTRRPRRPPKQSLAETEDQWLKLEMMREEIEA